MTLRFALAIVVTGCAAPVPPPTLAISIDRRCTTCDDFVVCTATAGGAPTLYHLEPKSFLAQAETIIDYLLQAVWQRRADERVVRIHDGSGVVTSSVAAIDLRDSRIRILDRTIDQLNGNWLGPDGSVIGACELLPLAEGRKRVAASPVPSAPDHHSEGNHS
jgi:hypothetical protein